MLVLGRASAQTVGVVNGTDGACPSTPVQWMPSEAGSECELEMEPCPAGRVGTLPLQYLLRYSVGYPDTDGLTLEEYPAMCELRILQVNDPAVYNDCQNQTGFVTMVVNVDRIVDGVLQTEDLCRLLQPAECPAGVQIRVDTCRAVERRPWTCPAGYRPKNEYLECYRLHPTGPLNPHPACGAGAPAFVAQSCADYAGNDYADAPAAVDCTADFPTANPPSPTTALSGNSTPGMSSDYWCEFDAALLSASCHPAPQSTPECTPSLSMCLKRASRTGGCSAIASTIRCRDLQQTFRAGTATAEEVRNEGCEPCVVLPFSPVPPGCPADVSAEPQISLNQAMHHLLRLREDFNAVSDACVDSLGNISAVCQAQPTCTDPPTGALTWSSSHHSRLAIVNSQVTLNVADVPVEERRVLTRLSSSGLGGSRLTFPYPSSRAGAIGDSILTYGRIDPTASSLTTVTDMNGAYGECVYRRGPLFQLTIRQLWPDDPADESEIAGLFGSAALDWWNALTTPAERQEAIESRGLGYWPNLSAADRALRTEELTEHVLCNYDRVYRAPVWCRWIPTAPGYYRITAGGAWVGARWDRGSRHAISGSERGAINRALQAPAVRDTVAAQLTAAGLTPADVGLNATLTAVLPAGGLTGDSRFSGVATERSCGGRDLRIRCGVTNIGTGNYTETRPIGVAVHEVRLATRQPAS
ncbi:MAG: hypothetical protein OXI26_11195 [bacterium]|nr:hypothetical protein [bacterium]